MKLKATKVFEKNWNADKRFIVNQGGTRSSKTYSIAQKYALKLHSIPNKRCTIVRKTTPAFKLTVLRDFLEVLESIQIPVKFNKSDHTIDFGNGSIAEFISMDDAQKKRGSKRDWLWLNEANELSLEDFRQLNMRTTEEVTLDYNPSDEFHWIYEEVIPREDAVFIKSTYLDNPFLSSEIIREIERYQEIDPNYWRVYGLGERGASEATVFTNKWEIIPQLPDNLDEYAFGVDFGFNHPMAMVKVAIKDDELYWHEMYYEKGKITSDLIRTMEQTVRPRDFVVCDHERDRIQEIINAGYVMTTKADKNDKLSKLDQIKKKKMYVTETSVNLIKEMRNYKFKVDRDGVVQDDVVKINDDAIDAAQYASTFLLKLSENKPRTY